MTVLRVGDRVRIVAGAHRKRTAIVVALPGFPWRDEARLRVDHDELLKPVTKVIQRPIADLVFVEHLGQLAFEL